MGGIFGISGGVRVPLNVVGDLLFEPPRNIVITPGDGEASFAFDAPARTGQHTITGYEAEVADESVPSVTGASSPLVLTGLTNETVYQGRMRATGTPQNGEWSTFQYFTPTGVAPTITTHPSSRTADEGSTATFTVVASGTAPLAYQWRLNGADISGATSASYTTPTLTLTDDGNSYDCVVSNAYGTATSNAAVLTVEEVSATSLDSVAQIDNADTVNHTLGASANLVVIFIHSQGASTRPNFDSVTYGGVAATVWSGQTNGVDRLNAYYVPAVDLPAAGTHAVTVTVSNSADYSTEISVMSFNGAPQNFNFDSRDTVDPLEVTAAAGALIATAMSLNTENAITPGASALQTANAQIVSSHATITSSLRTGYLLDAGAAGVKNVDWDGQGSRPLLISGPFE